MIQTGIKDHLFWKASRDRIPLSGTFELSPVCNLNCRMCYARRSVREVTERGGLLSREQWLSIARDAVKKGMLFLLLTGGEPFLYPEFKDLYEDLQALGLMISINSNGTLLNEETVQWLSKKSPVRINVTLYGASRESYLALCGDAGAFDRVQKGIKLLRQYQIPVRLNASLTPQNSHELKDICELAKLWKIPLAVVTYMFPPARRPGFQAGMTDRLTPQEAAKKKVEYDSLMFERELFIKKAEQAGQRFHREKSSVHPEETGCKMRCRAGRCSFWVTWEGRMNMCGVIDHPSVDLQQLGFDAAWKQIVKATDAVRFSPQCATCEKRELCHPCAAMSWCETGSFAGTPRYLCDMTTFLVQEYKEKLKLLKAGDEIGEN